MLLRVPTRVMCCLLLIGSASAQAQELNWAQKMFERQKIDFGVVARGADATFHLKVTNRYVQPVHITSVRTSCGCAAASPSKDTLASQESAYIKVTMDTRRFIREKNSNVIVTFDAPQYQEVTIPIRAYIRTDVVLTPGSAEFGAVAHGADQQRKVGIAYAGRSDWAIHDVVSKNEHVVAKLVETSRGDGKVNYDLVIELKPSAPIGELRDQVMLLTNDQNSPQIPVLVEAKIEADITVTPEIVSLGTLTPGQRKTVNVVLRGRKPFGIEKIESETGSEAFQVRLPQNPSLIHVVPLIIIAPAEPGPLNEEFTVTVTGKPQPLHFKVSGKVAGTPSVSTTP